MIGIVKFRVRHIFAAARIGIASACLLLIGCSSQVSDMLVSSLPSFLVDQTGQVSVVYNSTTEKSTQCMKDNQVVLQVSAPPGSKFLCRDQSTLSPGLHQGPVCPGGVSILEFPVDNHAVSCSKVTVCGIAPKSQKEVGKRFDGTPILELTYEGLPWGCDALVETSEDPSFSEATTKAVKVQIAPPECPFCKSENRASCLACAELGDKEIVKAGQVIPTTCTGAACKSCNVAGKTIAHGQPYTFFSSSQSQCGVKCAEQSLVRVCNNGLFEGSAKYNQSQCVDVDCGCRLPGTNAVVDSGTIKDFFKTTLPACGGKCESVHLTCKDGSWLKPDLTAASEEEKKTYGKLNCTEPVCHCTRTGRATVADGTSREVFSKASVACTDKCADVAAQVTCEAGTLTSKTAGATKYAFDSCVQSDCGCKVSLATGEVKFIADKAKITLYSKDQNTIGDPDLCDKSMAEFTCDAGMLKPALNASVFKYGACKVNVFACTYGSGTSTRQVASGSKLTVFKSASPVCGNQCESIDLACDDGTFKKPDGSAIDAAFKTMYAATTCALRKCDCDVNGFIIPHGQSKDMYSKSSGACDPKVCENSMKTLTCTAGVITGGDAEQFVYDQCSVNACSCKLADGSLLDSGHSMKFFAIDKATCGNPGLCGDPANFVDVACSNGVLTNFDSGRFKYRTCGTPECGCHHAGVTVETGKSGFFYQTNSPGPGISCASISDEFVCQVDGSFTAADGKPVGNYLYSECTSDLDQGTFGGTGGGSGNDEGPGSAFRRRYGSDGGGGPGDCFPVENCGTTSIVADTGATIKFYSRDGCALPWGLGEVEHYSMINAFRKDCVVKPAKCSSERQLRMCHYQGWTGDSEYKYVNCEEKDSCP